MLGRRWPNPIHLRKGASLVVSLILFWSAVLPYFLFHVRPVYGNQPAVMRPSQRPVFFGTTGDIEINVTVPGFAVKIEIPWEFVPVSAENDTSFVWSTITEDYWYYNVTDAREHFPYDPNAPWYVIIWSWNLTGFTPPQIVRLNHMTAPSLAGLYNVTIYVSTALSPARKPIFPTTPTKIMTILVCRSRDWATVDGYLIDPEVPNGIVVKTKGVVYAFNVGTLQREARALVNATTGFFNLTGLRPGNYFFEACAGYFPTTGFAYALTNQSQWGLTRLSWNYHLTMNMSVNRGARISGAIKYQDPLGNPIKSLDHPWLISLGYSAKGVLNWTVEAHDTDGKLVAIDFGNTLNLVTGDPFLLVVGKGRKYVGADPVGTEFCGIGLGTYDLTAYVFAYVQKQAVMPVQINQKGQNASTEILLKTGGVISGTIRLVQPRTPTTVLETPRQAEMRASGTATGTLFGGHVLVKAYRISDQSLKGIFVRNGTSMSGEAIYADANSISFHILGFNEYYNRSYSGAWKEKEYNLKHFLEYGLDEGTYNVTVHIRGYTQTTRWIVTLGLGSNQTGYINLETGGAIRTTVVSGIAWPYTMRMQMAAEWIALRELVHYRARVYHYDDSGVEYGYAEKILAPGQPDVQDATLTTVFSGMNYDLAEMVYWGYVPTTILPKTYVLKAFICGYVQATWPRVYVEYYCASARIVMLIACEVQIIGVLMKGSILYHLIENVNYRANLFDEGGTFVGGQIGNATVGTPSIVFSCRGFGGRGHFFFVTPDGVPQYDYGFGKGRFTLYLQRFGYLYRFEQISVPFSFDCLNGYVGYVSRVNLLNKIYGVVYGLVDGVPRRLSWATIHLVSFGEVTTSLDGGYWIFMPDGASRMQFSLINQYAEKLTDPIMASGGEEIGWTPIELVPV